MKTDNYMIRGLTILLFTAVLTLLAKTTTVRPNCETHAPHPRTLQTQQVSYLQQMQNRSIIQAKLPTVQIKRIYITSEGITFGKVLQSFIFSVVLFAIMIFVGVLIKGRLDIR